MPNITEEYKRFLQGDEQIVQKFNSPEFQQWWRQELKNTGRPFDPKYDGKNGGNLPWTGHYIPNNYVHEDVSDLIKAEKIVPGSGLLVSLPRSVLLGRQSLG
jgi:hypothetical protein